MAGEVGTHMTAHIATEMRLRTSNYCRSYTCTHLVLLRRTVVVHVPEASAVVCVGRLRQRSCWSPQEQALYIFRPCKSRLRRSTCHTMDSQYDSNKALTATVRVFSESDLLHLRDVRCHSE